MLALQTTDNPLRLVATKLLSYLSPRAFVGPQSPMQLRELPDLRIAFAHGGGAFPFTLGRIEHGFNVRPDLCATVNERNPREYVDRIWVDSLVHDELALRHLMSVHGADRIALGSDYPFPLGEHRPGELIESMADLTDRERMRMLSGSALEFLGRDSTS